MVSELTSKSTVKKLDEVDSFKYLGAVVTDQGSKHEVLSRIAQTTAALAGLKTIWSDKHIPPVSYTHLTLPTSDLV